MTRVLYRHFGPMLSLSVKGHANFAERGRDVVCAAVSALAFTLLIAATTADEREQAQLLRKTADPCGPVFNIEVRTEDERVRAVFEAVYNGLALIAGSYPENVCCEERGDEPPQSDWPTGYSDCG